MRGRAWSAVLGIAGAVLATTSWTWDCRAQTQNPADQAQAGDTNGAESDQDPSRAPLEKHKHSWELAPVTVKVAGDRLTELREEDRIGSYQQPRWTARRRFGETRIYVVPEGDVEFEYWLIPEWPRKGHETEIKSQYEIEMGLPGRFQLDLYLVTEKIGNQGSLDLSETKLEVRYALAKWGRLWGNPTLYAEWKAIDGEPDHVETKLLLGGEIATRLHWGANLVFEHEMGGLQTNAYELTAGLSRTVRDEQFSIGVESKLAWEDTKDDRGDFTHEALLGPSLQLRPLPQAHIDIAALKGLNHESPKAKLLLIIGWEF